MLFDVETVAAVNEAVQGFCVNHNMTLTPALARMGIAGVYRLYNRAAYQPITSGVAYQLDLEEPGIFGEDAPVDLVNYDEGGVDPTAFEEVSHQIFDTARRIK